MSKSSKRSSGSRRRPTADLPVASALSEPPTVASAAPRRLKVLFVAAEVAGFLRTGGLGDVAGALPRAVRARGVDIRVVMPLYRGVKREAIEKLDGELTVPMYFGQARAAIWMGHLPNSDVPIYFIEYDRFFDRPHPFGPPGRAYSDNLERFAFFSRAALELCKTLGFIPDVIHAHDWQSALVPVYVNTVEWSKPLHGAGTLFTIHNLAYQGNFEGGGMPVTGLGWEHFTPSEFEHWGEINLMKTAIRHSNLVSTVSPTYAREIQTRELGCGLDGELRRRRGDLRGVLNGIDTREWDPSKDPLIAATYDSTHLAPKARCKVALQRELGLPNLAGVPLFGITSRLTSQKGLDVLEQASASILKWKVQLVLLGKGDHDLETSFRSLARLCPDKFRLHIDWDEELAHRIIAGADFTIMPSRYEPCGLVQMYSQRYGTLPIVRGTGGLVDSVTSYDETKGTGTGFIFSDLYPSALANTVGWAVSTYFDRPRHMAAMRKQAMVQDFSWDRAAATYEQLYLEAYRIRRGHGFAWMPGTQAQAGAGPTTSGSAPDAGATGFQDSLMELAKDNAEAPVAGLRKKPLRALVQRP
jgi:starch synthase